MGDPFTRFRQLRIEHDGYDESRLAATVLERFRLNYAWPWETPRVHIAFGRDGVGGEALLLTLIVNARHSADGNNVELRQAQFVQLQQDVMLKFTAMLERFVVHEFHEALLFDNRHVTEPHQPEVPLSVKFSGLTLT